VLFDDGLPAPLPDADDSTGAVELVAPVPVADEVSLAEAVALWLDAPVAVLDEPPPPLDEPPPPPDVELVVVAGVVVADVVGLLIVVVVT
jgi:hypothetical protein